MSGVTDNTVFSDFEGSPFNPNSSPPHSPELPVDMYLERLSNTIAGFSKTMSINPDVWEKGTIDSKDSWEKLNDWFTAIEFKDQPMDVNVPYWGRVDIPTLEELRDLEKTDFTTKDVISRLFFVSSVLNIDIEYEDKQNDYSEESVKFGDLIAEVYPGLETSMRDIQEQLELAITDPEQFEKLFGSKENKGRSLRELFLARSKEITATSAVALMILLSGCTTPSEQDNRTPIVQILEEEEKEASPTTPLPTQTNTPTQTPTSTPTLAPTATNTPEPTQTPTVIPVSEDPYERGYFISDFLCEEGFCNELSGVKGEAQKIYVQDGEVVFDLNLRFYNIEKTVIAGGNEFAYYKIDRTTWEELIGTKLNTQSDLSEFLKTNTEYTFYFYIKGYPKFRTDLIEDYIRGEKDLEFTLTGIIEYIGGDE
jgi:hypothetical protein